MENLITLSFVKQYSIYQQGMIASFPESTANKMVALGVANLYAPSTPTGLAKVRDVASKMVKKST